MGVASRTRSKLKEKSRLKQEEAISRWKNVPEEISDEIFWKLPGNSILSSRCVCKLFKDRLSKPRFIKNHVNPSIQTKNSNPKLLFSGRSPTTPPMIYSMPLDYASISSSLPKPALLLNYPFESPTKTYWQHGFM
ncbi:hypothetical protein C5167_031164 [Papaver somniferum]|nr:hypothetical protein C5167_031164 [Papaver somniferum]